MARLLIFDLSNTLFDLNKELVLISRNKLETVKNKGDILAIFTASPKIEVERVVNSYYPDIFNKIVHSGSVINTKPDPEGLFIIIETFKDQFEEVIFIGDSLNDKLAAESAKVKFVEAHMYNSIL